MKKLYYIFIATAIFYSACSPRMSAKKRNDKVKRQKKTINQNCASYEGQNSVYSGINSLVDEPKSVTEKNFQNYILSNNPGQFPETMIIFDVVFQPNVTPCCRQTNISDSLKMDTKQIDFLTGLVLKYPVFHNVQFDKDEKVKYLRIYMGRHRKGEFSVGFGTN